MLQFIYILAGLGRDEYTVVVESGHPLRGAQVFERQILTLHRASSRPRPWACTERIHLVEHQYGRFGIATANIAQCLVDHFYLLLKIRMRYIHHMHQDVGLPHLIERRLERFNKAGRQLAYETYGVGEQERKIVNDDLAHRGVERGKQLVLGKHIALAQ